MEPVIDPEQVIQHLTDKGYKIQEIAERLGVDRNTLNKDRRTPKKVKLDELARKIMAKFPQEFPEGKVPDTGHAQDIDIDIAKNYIRLLEKSLAS